MEREDDHRSMKIMVIRNGPYLVTKNVPLIQEEIRNGLISINWVRKAGADRAAEGSFGGEIRVIYPTRVL